MIFVFRSTNTVTVRPRPHYLVYGPPLAIGRAFGVVFGVGGGFGFGVGSAKSGAVTKLPQCPHHNANIGGFGDGDATAAGSAAGPAGI